jgi:hypothetical protein
MSRLTFNNASAVPSTPAAGKMSIFSDSVNKHVKLVDENGLVQVLNKFHNYSVTSQAPAAATRTYITGSQIRVPKNKLQVGTQFSWQWNMTKTGAGTATSTIDVAIGTAGTTADTARLSFTKPAGTAVIDEGWCEVYATVRTIGATGVMVGEFRMTHNLASTGHMVIPSCCVNNISSGFDMTVADLFVGVCLTSGASDAITIQMMQAEAWNL